MPLPFFPEWPFPDPPSDFHSIPGFRPGILRSSPHHPLGCPSGCPSSPVALLAGLILLCSYLFRDHRVVWCPAVRFQFRVISAQWMGHQCLGDGTSSVSVCGTGINATVTEVGTDNELSQPKQSLSVTCGRVAAGLWLGISQQLP